LIAAPVAGSATAAQIVLLVLGRRYALNPVLILVSLIFWTWRWGVPDALRSAPIFDSIKVVCNRVPAMAPVSELLSRGRSHALSETA